MDNFNNSRRDFFRTIGRGVALFGAGVVAIFALKEPTESAQDGFCEIFYQCKTCRELSQCGLPQAIAYKHTGSEVKEND